MYEKGKNIKKPRYNDQSKQEGRNKKKMIKQNTNQEELKKKKDLNSRKDHLRPSKLLEFHSRQIHLIKQCGTNLQITILRCRLKLHDQQSNKSTTFCGITQQIPNKQKMRRDAHSNNSSSTFH